MTVLVVTMYILQVEEGEEEGDSDDDWEEETGGGRNDHLLTTPHGVGALRERLAVVETRTPTLCEYGSTPDYKGGQTQ